MNNKVTIDSSSIIPIIGVNQTQVILQRHCDYDRKNGGLIIESKKEQEQIINQFLSILVQNSIEELENTYFLFIASPTISRGNFQRCMDTTNIPFNLVRELFKELKIPETHIMNLNVDSNYGGNIHSAKQLAEPRMFTDDSGYFEFLKAKNQGINIDFWIDFEEDRYKEKRQELGGEGPDEIVDRGVRFIKAAERYSKSFHETHKNSKLIIWCGTHYDLLSPLIKQTILGYEKEESVLVNYCGGISIKINEFGEMLASLNGKDFPICFQDNRLPHRRF